MRSKVQPVQIAVVGGGPAGLSTAGALIKLGAKPLVFDRNDRIGDSWRRRYAPTASSHDAPIFRPSALPNTPIVPAVSLTGYVCGVPAVVRRAASDRGGTRMQRRLHRPRCLVRSRKARFRFANQSGENARIRRRRRNGHVRRTRHAASCWARRLSRYCSPCLRVQERRGVCSEARPRSWPRQHRGGDCNRSRRPWRELRRGERSLDAAGGVARPPRRSRSALRHRTIASSAGNCRPHWPGAVPIGNRRLIALWSSDTGLAAVLVAAHTGDRRRFSPAPQARNDHNPPDDRPVHGTRRTLRRRRRGRISTRSSLPQDTAPVSSGFFSYKECSTTPVFPKLAWASRPWYRDCTSWALSTRIAACSSRSNAHRGDWLDIGS